MYDTYSYNITVDDNSYSLELTDTAGQGNEAVFTFTLMLLLYERDIFR